MDGLNFLPVGAQAPLFALLDQDAEWLHFDEYLRQRTLICFFPKVMSPQCTLQACELRDHQEKFRFYDVELLGISGDSTEKLQRFHETNLLTFPLLSDNDYSVSRAYGTLGNKEFLGKQFQGIHRASFLINELGLVEAVFSFFDAKDHHQKVLNYLEHHAETVGTAPIASAF